MDDLYLIHAALRSPIPTVTRRVHIRDFEFDFYDEILVPIHTQHTLHREYKLKVFDDGNVAGRGEGSTRIFCP